MTTITKERIELFVKSPLENGLTRGEQMELARIALASLTAEPVAYIFKHPAGELFWSLTDESNKDQNDVMPVYASPPVQETGVYKDMLNIISLLENNEWAEHCTSTVLGSLLESEITRLVGKEQSAPVVLTDEQREQLRQMDDEIVAELESEEIACRAAMLQANQRDLSQPVAPQVTEYEQIMLQAGWVMVPKTVTPEISLAINKVGQHCTCGNCSQRVWDMLLAAAPEPDQN